MVVMGLTFDLCIEFDEPVSKAYKSLSITSQTLCRCCHTFETTWLHLMSRHELIQLRELELVV